MKPELALVNLNRREPIVYFGCTWTEIKACIWRGAAIALPITVVLMVVSPVPVLMLIPGVLSWLGLTRVFLSHIHRNRAGKPLFYERHKKWSRHPAFIRAGKLYQVARHPAKTTVRGTRLNR